MTCKGRTEVTWGGVTAPVGTQQQGWQPGGDLLQRLLLLLMASPPFIW